MVLAQGARSPAGGPWAERSGAVRANHRGRCHDAARLFLSDTSKGARQEVALQGLGPGSKLESVCHSSPFRRQDPPLANASSLLTCPNPWPNRPKVAAGWTPPARTQRLRGAQTRRQPAPGAGRHPGGRHRAGPGGGGRGGSGGGVQFRHPAAPGGGPDPGPSLRGGPGGGRR